MNPISPIERVTASRWRYDLAVVMVLTAVTAWASAHWNVAEFLAREFRLVEQLQLDEAPGVLLVFAAGSLWYAWRRYREARDALARSHETGQRLTAVLADNRRLIRQYAHALESERARLSRELHDELGQYLNAVKIDAVSLRHLRDTSAAVGEIAGGIVRNIDHMQASVVGLIRELRPVGLDVLGIEAALEHCVAGWRERLPETAVTLRCYGELSGLDESLGLTIYRIVQEGLTNVVRHAQASRVEVTVWRAQAVGGGSELRVDVVDDGHGRDVRDDAGTGLGLLGMRERVEALDGEFRVETAPGKGFRLVAAIPVAEQS